MSEPELKPIEPAPAETPREPEEETTLAERLATPRPRNLLFLLAFCVVTSIIIVVVSVWIYDATGDKYLDRSRPGYISEEIDDEKTPAVPDNNFSDTGKIDASVLREFLEGFDSLTEHAIRDQYFSPDSLSDESLGIDR